MKTSYTRVGKSGFVSYVLVLSTGLILTLLTVFFYRSTMDAHKVQQSVQLHVDYAEKEDAVLRGIVAITPNRVMRAMMNDSNNSAIRETWRWRNIFGSALTMANAKTSVDLSVKTQLGITNHIKANVGDTAVSSDARKIFNAINTLNDNDISKYCTSGLNVSQGFGYPPPLQTSDAELLSRDKHSPLVGPLKQYGSLAESYLNHQELNGNGVIDYGVAMDYFPDTDLRKGFNRLTYPNINFGYAKPGDPFVAKRNWWAFEMDLAGQDFAVTKLTKFRRKFVISIYEIPSQLAISTSAFVSLGRHASGAEWTDVNIEGGVFAGKANVEGSLNLPSISGRRGMTLSSDSRIAGRDFSDDPFAAGKRETDQLTYGEFYPVSLASESGRVAFIPINRGEDFFDRFGHTAETNVLSLTTWNNYTIGALQCAMNLDVTAVNIQKMPTVLRFRAKKNDGSIVEFSQPVITGINQPLPPGYTVCAQENESYDFGERVVDVAYGVNGKFYYQPGVTGLVNFNNARFTDPNVGRFKAGYWRPAAPFKVSQSAAVDPDLLNDTSWRVEIFPERMPAFLAIIGASDTSINHSLSVNVDYTISGLNAPDYHPMKGSYKYGLIMRECANLTLFTKGFSVVSNLRTYIADNFNLVPTTRPEGYTESGDFYPPVSLFVPEKRFGVNIDPTAVRLDGQIGSLASEEEAMHLLDTKGTSGTDYTGSRLQINLRPINHPAALPPITMMNWLVVLEELRQEHTTP
jgi:hypothetical protein